MLILKLKNFGKSLYNFLHFVFLMQNYIFALARKPLFLYKEASVGVLTAICWCFHAPSITSACQLRRSVHPMPTAASARITGIPPAS